MGEELSLGVLQDLFKTKLSPSHTNLNKLTPLPPISKELGQNPEIAPIAAFLKEHGGTEAARAFEDFVNKTDQAANGDGINAEELHQILGDFAKIMRWPGGESNETAKLFSDPKKRAELIVSAIKDFKDAKGEQSQGILETCGAAASITGMLASDQARYTNLLARIVDGYDEKSKITLPAGTAAVLGTKEISLSGHLAQVWIMHTASGSYDPLTDKSERRWMSKYSSDPADISQSGLYSDELARALQTYYSEKNAPRSVRRESDFGPDNRDALQERISKALEEGRPLVMSMRDIPTNGVAAGIHFVSIIGQRIETDPATGDQKSFVIFKDTRGPNYPIDFTRTRGGISFEDQARNTYKVSMEDLCSKYANFMLEVNSAEMTRGSYDSDLITEIDPNRLWETQGANLQRFGEGQQILILPPSNLIGQSIYKSANSSGGSNNSLITRGNTGDNRDEYYQKVQEYYLQRKRRQLAT